MPQQANQNQFDQGVGVPPTEYAAKAASLLNVPAYKHSNSGRLTNRMTPADAVQDRNNPRDRQPDVGDLQEYRAMFRLHFIFFIFLNSKTNSGNTDT